MKETEKIAAQVADGARIDRERIDVREHEDMLVVAIAGCTESQRRAAQVVMHQHVGGRRRWKVVPDEMAPTPPAKPPAYDLDNLKVVIAKLGEAPDGQLDKMFSLQCANLPADADLEHTLRFLRNMRDECVYCAGGSGFVMTLFNSLLEGYPEPEEVMAERRAELERRYNM